MKTSDVQPHLLDYLNVVLKRKKIFLVCFVVTILAVAVTDYFAQPIYLATSRIVINYDRSGGILSGRSSNSVIGPSDEAFLNSHYERMTSRPVLVKVAMALGLEQGKEEKKQDKAQLRFPFLSSFLSLFGNGRSKTSMQPDPEETLLRLAGGLKGKIAITPVLGTDLVDVGVEDAEPKRAMEIANTLIDTYIQHDFESNLGDTKKMFSLLNEQLLEMRKELEESQGSIDAFKEKEKIFSMEGQQKIQSMRIDELNAQSFKTKTQRMEIDARVDELERLLKAGDYKGFIPTAAESEMLRTLYRDLIQSEIELSQLQEVSGFKHPLLAPPEAATVMSKIGFIKKELNKELKRTIENLRIERSILENRQRTIDSALKKMEAEAFQSNKIESKYRPLEQEAKTNQQLYDLLLTKLKESSVLEGMKQTGIRVIEPALLPKNPIKPKKMLNLILGALVGLILGTGSAFFQEYLDRAIKTPEEIQRYLSLPVLCMVPKVSMKEGPRRA